MQPHLPHLHPFDDLHGQMGAIQMVETKMVLPIVFIHFKFSRVNVRFLLELFCRGLNKVDVHRRVYFRLTFFNTLATTGVSQASFSMSFPTLTISWPPGLFWLAFLDVENTKFAHMLSVGDRGIFSCGIFPAYVVALLLSFFNDEFRATLLSAAVRSREKSAETSFSGFLGRSLDGLRERDIVVSATPSIPSVMEDSALGIKRSHRKKRRWFRSK